MKKVMIFAAVAEAATGLALLLAPSPVGQLLLGQQLAGVALPVARLAGIALIALGISCWPGRKEKPVSTPRQMRGRFFPSQAVAGMLIYGISAASYLAYLGFAGEATGVLLWPAVALHLLLSIVLGYAGLKRQTS